MIEQSADVDARARVADSARVWHLAQVREGADIGDECIIGRSAYIDHGVAVGARSKVQNNALVYAPATLEEGVFIGPAAVLTNDLYPRSIDPDGCIKSADGWDAAGVTVRKGASIGARAVVLPGIEIGEWALVAAGAVVTRSVPPHALVVGVPARQVGWVGKSAHQLVPADDDASTLVDPETGDLYNVHTEGVTPK